MNRRKFIKNMLGSGVAASSYMLGNSLSFSTANAAHNSGSTPTLVVVFQRGGCDGLNTVVPYGEAEYYNLRQTIGIAAPDASDPNACLAINDSSRGFTDFFGLNPNLSSLLPIYNTGDLAVFPTVHYPNNSHSHFSGQDFIETAYPNNISDGWLYRHLSTQNSLGGLEAISFGGEVSNSLRGNKVVQSLTFLSDFNFPTASGDILSRLNENVLPLFNAAPATNSPNQRLVHDTGQLLFSNIDAVSAINTETYIPSNGASYPNTSYGRRMRESAQLIKQDLGVEVITVSIGGYDTHSNQGGGEATGQQSRRLKEFSDGMAALYTDLGTRMDNVIILSMTEFGRTAKENGSNGTDHGDASSWFMLGKNIQGGIHGSWPGLAADQLARGRYLRYTQDYRDIYGDILLNHLGHSTAELSTLLPTHTYTPVGLFT